MIERIATLEEINTSWSLIEINKANALLDMKADIKAQAIEDAKKK